MKFIVSVLLISVAMNISIINAAEFSLENTIKIITPDKSDIITNFAAKELKKHLILAGAKKCSITTETDDKSLQFHIGKSPQDFKPQLKKSEARYSIRGRNIYIWGDNKTGSLKNLKEILLASRYSRCGVLSATYLFLNKELGIKWLCPGDKGVVCQKRNLINLNDKTDFAWTPPLNMAIVRVYWWRYHIIAPLNHIVPKALQCSEKYVNQRQFEDAVWFRRMLLGTKNKISYHHAFNSWWKKYGKDHPEWFGKTAYGQRGLRGKLHKRNKLCLSNDEVVDQIIKEWRANGTPKYLNICPNDGTPGFCRCQNCMALDTRKENETFYDHLTDRYLYFWNKIADKAVKIRPDVVLITYVYSYYRFPPRREKVKYPDNMLFGMVPMMFEDNNKIFGEWQKCGAKNVFLRPNDLCIGSPFFIVFEKRIYDKFQVAKRFNLFGVDYDGACGVRTNDLAFYVTARMVTFPEKTFSELENEYYSGFGKAAGIVKDFYAHYRNLGEVNLEKAVQLLKMQKRKLLDSGQLNQVIMNNINVFYKLENFKKASQILARCKQEQLSPQCRKRFQDLVVLNKHAEKTFLFISEAAKKSANKPNQLEKASAELLKFREKENKSLAWNWPSLWRRQENKFWSMSNSYRKALGLSSVPADKKRVFWSSFDLPAMDGWRKRKLFSKLTSETASCDKYSVELRADKEYGMGISLHRVKVSPQKRYRIEYDYLLSDDNSPQYLRLRCVGAGLSKSKTLFNIVNRKKNKFWQTYSHTFKIPPEVNNISLYFIVGPGQKDQKVYLDKISLNVIPESEK